MADPHIQSPMDFLDKLTVAIYRSGFVLAAMMMWLLPYQNQTAHLGLLVAAVCCASSLHIYVKQFRYLLQFATWLALLCQLFGYSDLALGGALLTLGGLCFKEYFCFRVFALNFQPILVALIWVANVFHNSLALQILTAISGLLLAVLAVQKWRMPLHFDIGDKNKYQV